jgi:hypothetical protein
MNHCVEGKHDDHIQGGGEGYVCVCVCNYCFVCAHNINHRTRVHLPASNEPAVLDSDKSADYYTQLNDGKT